MSVVPEEQGTLPSYLPAAPVKPKSGHAKTIIIVVMALVLAGLGVALKMQYDETTRAVDSKDKYKAVLAETRVVLKTTQEDLTASEDSLDSANSTISGQQDRLGDCKAVTRVSEHQGQAITLMLDSMEDDTLVELYASIGYLRRATGHLRSINNIVKEQGYLSVPELREACVSGGTVL